PGEKTNNLRVVLVKFRPAPENTDTAVAIVELFRRSLEVLLIFGRKIRIKIMKKTIIIFFSILFLTPFSLKAYVVKKISLKEMFSRSSQVAQVEISNGKRNIILRNNKNYDCGFKYMAEVVFNFKGKKRKIAFGSESKLIIGGRYLVFLNLENLDAKLNYLAMGRADVNGYETCTEGGELYASAFHSEIFEFDPLWEVITGDLAVKSILEAPFIGSMRAKKIMLKSDEAPEKYLQEASYWIIPWDEFELKLDALSLK
ncbi:hypothetical protein, partial [Microbulbifer sp. TYP-18]|uniref:hypothetical protein n=1 Tax=Microbulbifer sp. TYP-18 TaxID=3230024 RepID=UPI0034C61D37